MFIRNSAIVIFQKCSFSFLLRQKRNKKGDPKTKTARFRDGSLIKLLHYCDELHLSPAQRLKFKPHHGFLIRF